MQFASKSANRWRPSLHSANLGYCFDDSLQRPSLSHCDSVAKSLISVHNFLKDKEGDDGEVLMNTYRVNCNNYCIVL